VPVVIRQSATIDGTAGRPRCHHDAVSVAELLDELAHGIPDLHGAACRGHPEVFDVADRRDRQAIAQAKTVCASCPVLDTCRAWLVSLPKPVRPCGVVAARYLPPPTLRPTYEPRLREPSCVDLAIVWLRGYLAERGSVVSTEVIVAATAAGFSRSTLRKARIELNVRLQRVPGGVGARHLWVR
jgi:hypothetical protein